jgi:hypothetical protein
MRTAHTLALWLFAAMAVLAPRLATAARVVYKCVPSPGHPCPGTVVIRQLPPPPPAAPVHTLQEHQEEQQEYRIAALEKSAGQFRVEGGILLDTDGNVGGQVGVGGSWLIGNDLAIADGELILGRTQAGNDSFTIGGRGDFMFIIADWLRAGPGFGLNVYFGDEHISFGPDLGAEFGPNWLYGFIRAGMPIVVANDKANGGLDAGLVTLGGGGRF